MKKILTLLLSFILPGVGHISHGRIAVGAAFFLAEAVILNCYVFLVLPWYGAAEQFNEPDSATAWRATLVLACLAAVWIICQGHLVYLLYPRDPRRFTDEKELAFREGLRYYVRGELPEAIRQFEHVMRLDPADCDACFHLGVCYSRAGSRRRALRRFRKCSELDDARKWSLEIEEELDRLKEEQGRRRAQPQGAARENKAAEQN